HALLACLDDDDVVDAPRRSRLHHGLTLVDRPPAGPGPALIRRIRGMGLVGAEGQRRGGSAAGRSPCAPVAQTAVEDGTRLDSGPG
ncbi:MAG: hypothetical protein LC708_02045, partial [Actinobacteria bacterium]|nr:hypothetical protein [Actinomycetota bacterium]